MGIMRRTARIAMAAAMLAGVIGVSAASADESCDAGPSWLYCGEHVRLQDLPLTFKTNAADSPLATGKFRGAVQAALDEWNESWPLEPGGESCAALCLDGATGKSEAARDGVNAIFWSATTSYPGCAGPEAAIARTCIWYENGDPSSGRIDEVDIVLNLSGSWATPSGAEALAGEVAGTLYPDLGNMTVWSGAVGHGRGTFDLQSVLTHEFGHAIGIEHIGADNGAWPFTAADAPKYQQTMYRWYYEGTTNKRTLAEGDVIALQLAAQASANDP